MEQVSVTAIQHMATVSVEFTPPMNRWRFVSEAAKSCFVEDLVASLKVFEREPITSRLLERAEAIALAAVRRAIERDAFLVPMFGEHAPAPPKRDTLTPAVAEMLRRSKYAPGDSARDLPKRMMVECCDPEALASLVADGKLGLVELTDLELGFLAVHETPPPGRDVAEARALLARDDSGRRVEGTEWRRAVESLIRRAGR